MRLLIVFLTLCSMIGCVKVEPFKEIPAYSVYSILNPADSIISVFVGRTFRTGEFFSIDSGKAIANARVEIRNKSTTKIIEFDNSSKSYLANNSGFLRAGEEYYLSIEIEDEILEGYTLIPELPTLKLDQAEITANSEGQIQVFWEKSKLDNSIYRLVGSVDLRSNVFALFYWDQDEGVWETSDKLNSSNVIKSPLGSFNFVSSSKEAFVKIDLFSFDENYDDFRKKENVFQLRSDFSRLFESPVIFNSNVSNSIGIFGSYVVSSLNIKMMKE